MVGKGEGETHITGSALPLFESLALLTNSGLSSPFSKEAGYGGLSENVFGETEIIHFGWELRN